MQKLLLCDEHGELFNINLYLTHKMTTEMSAASELIHEKFQSRKATSEVRPAIPFMAEQVLAKERADENPMELSQIALMFAMFGFTSKVISSVMYFN